MHGLINRSIQCFVRDTYGPEQWHAVARGIGYGPEGFEAMLDYDDSITEALIDEAASSLSKSRSAMLEDLGTYLVSHETTRGVRRLLRFSGETFVDFLYSLDDLPSRAKLAVPELDLPDLELREDPPGRFRLFVISNQAGWGDVMRGLLCALADDFGALVLMNMAPGAGVVSVIEITLLDGEYAEGRSFSLSDTENRDGADPGSVRRAGSAEGRRATRTGTVSVAAGGGRSAGTEAEAELQDIGARRVSVSADAPEPENHTMSPPRTVAPPPSRPADPGDLP